MSKAWSTREIAKLAKANGYVYERSKGDHDIYKKGEKILVINNGINKMVARRLIKEHNLKDDWTSKK